jgi:hypothetical protein
VNDFTPEETKITVKYINTSKPFDSLVDNAFRFGLMNTGNDSRA